MEESLTITLELSCVSAQRRVNSTRVNERGLFCCYSVCDNQLPACRQYLAVCKLKIVRKTN